MNIIQKNAGIILVSHKFILEGINKIKQDIDIIEVYKTPESDKLHLELNDTLFFSPKENECFRSYIEMTQWASNLCHPDITQAVQRCTMFQAKLRSNYIQAILRVQSYLKANMYKVFFVNTRKVEFTAEAEDINV